MFPNWRQFTERKCLTLTSAVFAVMIVLALAVPDVAWAAPHRLTVRCGDSVDPAPSGTSVVYDCRIQNDLVNPIPTYNVKVDISLPPGATLVSCWTSEDRRQRRDLCQGSGGSASADFGTLKSRQRRRLLITVQMPTVAEVTDVDLTASATGQNADSGRDTETTTVLPGDHEAHELLVSISGNPSEAVSQGTVRYTIGVLNDLENISPTLDAEVKVRLPVGTSFVSCTTSRDGGGVQYCQESAGTVLAALGHMQSFATATVKLTLQMPLVAAVTKVKVKAEARGENAINGEATAETSVLAGQTTAILSPSLQEKVVRCGDTLDSSFFGSNTSARLVDGLGCALVPFALRIAASGVTLDLGGRKLIAEQAAGTVGILIGVGRTDVTVDGSGTDGDDGIEHFDWCIKDEGGNTNLRISDVRCFRARSAGFDIVSSDVLIDKCKVDNTTSSSSTTAELPGGVGIHVRGDNVRVKDTIVRRSQNIGLWADGTDTDGGGLAVTMDGNLLGSRVEDNRGIGVLFEWGPHKLKGTAVHGEGLDVGTSTDGIMIAANGINNIIQEVQVKKHRGDGVVDEGFGTFIERTHVEETAGDGFVIMGSNALLNNNFARPERHGIVVSGTDVIMTTNTVEEAGLTGFFVTGDRAVMQGNSSQANGRHGYELRGDAASLNTNSAEQNRTKGMLVIGNSMSIENCSVKDNNNIGVHVTGNFNRFHNVSAERNRSYEWVISSNNIDDSNNSANGTRFSFDESGGRFE